jgi:hypothetical protein
MDRLSRWWFAATGSILVLLATGLVVTGVYQVAAALVRVVLGAARKDDPSTSSCEAS